MNNQYLIPANSKKGQLLFNLFRPIDLAILVVGGMTTLILFFALDVEGIIVPIACLLPLAISILLVMPVAHYHNVLVFLQEVYLFLVSQRQFRWKGWCASNYGKSE